MDFIKNNTNQETTIIIPTYYPGEKIVKLLQSISSKYQIFIVDNGNDPELKNIVQHYSNIKHYIVGDVGLGKSFNFALSNISSAYAFITQPDVTLFEGSIDTLVRTIKKYPNAAIVAPLYFEKNIYSPFDYYDLKISKLKKIVPQKKFKNLKNILPEGDISVEAVNSTALLIDVEKILSIGGWDDNFYTYLEDIDLCLRLRQKGYEIIKSPLSKIDHVGFSSHKEENKKKMDISRNWNFCWSSIYFCKKHRTQLFFFKYLFKITLKYLFKIILNFILNNKKKLIIYQIRFDACIKFILGKRFAESKWKELS